MAKEDVNSQADKVAVTLPLDEEYHRADTGLQGNLAFDAICLVPGLTT